VCVLIASFSIKEDDQALYKEDAFKQSACPIGETSYMITSMTDYDSGDDPIDDYMLATV
jgi:hypothetical protein